jgi:hypothetical protein
MARVVLRSAGREENGWLRVAVPDIRLWMAVEIDCQNSLQASIRKVALCAFNPSIRNRLVVLRKNSIWPLKGLAGRNCGMIMAC